MAARRRSARSLIEGGDKSRFDARAGSAREPVRGVAGPDDGAPASRVRGSGRLARPRRGRSPLTRMAAPCRLFTATIAFSDGEVMLQAFHASVARHPAEVVQRLRGRFGDEAVLLAEIRVGFHPAAPVAMSLVPTVVADMIRLAERSGGALEHSAFVVDIEQRIEI